MVEVGDAIDITAAIRTSIQDLFFGVTLFVGHGMTIFFAHSVI